MAYFGLDVSSWQGNINFLKIVETGKIDFMILRAGGSDGSYFRDPKFEYNYKMCKQFNIPVGVYYIVGKQCKNGNAGLNDAKHFSELIKGKQFEMPVYIDVELPPTNTKKGNTDAVIMFCEYMENLHYYVGVYGSDISGFQNRLELNRLNAYDKWVARYGCMPLYVKKYGIWQASSKGIIDGIKGNVDCNVSYNDYPTIIKQNHLNGF